MELTLHIDLEPRLSLPEIQEFERKAKSLGKTASDVVAELIRTKFLARQNEQADPQQEAPSK